MARATRQRSGHIRDRKRRAKRLLQADPIILYNYKMRSPWSRWQRGRPTATLPVQSRQCGHGGSGNNMGTKMQRLRGPCRAPTGSDQMLQP
eukprot:3467922-Pyramimonas_sp.AAC.1